MNTLDLKIPPLFLVVTIGILMVFASDYLPRVEVVNWISFLTALAVVVAGVIFCICGVWQFRKNKTTVDPRYPANTSHLVDSGIYSLSRNPMYVGFSLFLLSIVLLLRSPVLILGVLIFIMYMNRFQIASEEIFLSKSFGERYELYKQRVRRWL